LSRANARDPKRFRILHFSVQHDHVHLIVEASDERALSEGVRSVSIRIARYVNELVGRSGRFWADRWFGRELRTPREVRHALVYVLANFRKHARGRRPRGVDPYSSGVWFDGWRGVGPGVGGRYPLAGPRAPCEDESVPVSRARAWLAAVGWRRHGLIGLDEAPGGHPPGAS
jgi:hypothetical protein